jgi:hypothetical protein
MSKALRLGGKTESAFHSRSGGHCTTTEAAEDSFVAKSAFFVLAGTSKRRKLAELEYSIAPSVKFNLQE